MYKLANIPPKSHAITASVREALASWVKEAQRDGSGKVYVLSREWLNIYLDLSDLSESKWVGDVFCPDCTLLCVTADADSAEQAAERFKTVATESFMQLTPGSSEVSVSVTIPVEEGKDPANWVLV